MLSSGLRELEDDGAVVDDMSFMLRGDPRPFWVDGCHLSEDGYRMVADRIHDLLLEHWR